MYVFSMQNNKKIKKWKKIWKLKKFKGGQALSTKGMKGNEHWDTRISYMRYFSENFDDQYSFLPHLSIETHPKNNPISSHQITHPKTEIIAKTSVANS